MRATGRVVHQSRRLFIADAQAADEEGQEVARGTGTFMRSTIPLRADLGYL